MQPFLLTISAILCRCISAIATSIANITIRVKADPRLVSSDELITEAEHTLHKIAGGLSLFEKLEQDGSLRDQLLKLIYEMQTEVQVKFFD